LTPVAAELVEQVHQIKRDLAASAERAGLDPIAWLDLNRAGWRDSLPLDMGDEDARPLIEHVVRRAERGALGDIGLQRGLVQKRRRLAEVVAAYANCPDHRRIAAHDPSNPS
jgi:hypothetical protein